MMLYARPQWSGMAVSLQREPTEECPPLATMTGPGFKWYLFNYIPLATLDWACLVQWSMGVTKLPNPAHMALQTGSVCKVWNTIWTQVSAHQSRLSLPLLDVFPAGLQRAAASSTLTSYCKVVGFLPNVLGWVSKGWVLYLYLFKQEPISNLLKSVNGLITQA